MLTRNTNNETTVLDETDFNWLKENNIQTALNTKSNIGHTHSVNEITDIAIQLNNKSDVGHGHSISDITNLQTELSNKSDTGHNHTISDITNLQTELNNKFDKTGGTIDGNIDVNNFIDGSKLRIGNYIQTTHYPELVLGFYDFSNQDNLGYDFSGRNRHGVVQGIQYSLDNGGCGVFTQVGDAQSPYNTNTNQFIDLTDYLDVYQNKQNITISGWFKSAPDSTYRGIINFSNRNYYREDILIYVNNDGTFIFQFRQADVNIFRIISANRVDDNQWHHFVVSLGDNECYAYLDNVKLTDITNYGGSSNLLLSLKDITITDMRIGSAVRKQQGGSTRYNWLGFNGSINQIVLFDYQLSEQEILNLFNENYGYDVICLAGQSNMVGRAVIESGIDDDYGIVNGHVFQFPYKANQPNLLTITNAINTLDHNDTKTNNTTGLWKTFSENILNSLHSRRKLLLVPVAQGGTGFVDNEWNKGDPCYNGAVNSLNRAMTTHSLNTLKAILWHQGESDINANELYNQRLTNMYNNMKNDINDFTNETLFIVGEIKGPLGDYKVDLINEQLKYFSQSGKRRGYIETMDLELKTDNLHYTATSLREMGRRYAKEYLKYVFNPVEDVFLDETKITKNLSVLGNINNSNLQTQLNNKSDTGHTHTISDITNLQTELNSKVNLSGTQTISGSKTLTESLNITGNVKNLIFKTQTNDLDDTNSILFRNSANNYTWRIGRRYNPSIEPSIFSARLIFSASEQTESDYNNMPIDVLTLKQNGNVGIGNDNPQENLHVNGNIRSDNLTANTALVSDTNKNIISSSVTDTELGYLSGATSNIQTQINNITGIPSLTANRALISNGSGVIATSSITNTELDALSGVTSNIQTQINTKVPEVKMSASFNTPPPVITTPKIYTGRDTTDSSGDITISWADKGITWSSVPNVWLQAINEGSSYLAVNSVNTSNLNISSYTPTTGAKTDFVSFSWLAIGF